MSVDTTAGFFYGWVVSDEEREEMCEQYHFATGESIDDCFEILNAYEPHTWMFVTCLSYFPDPGHCRIFHQDEFLDIPGQEFYDEYSDILITAGRRDLVDGWHPEVFVVHTIW